MELRDLAKWVGFQVWAYRDRVPDFNDPSGFRDLGRDVYILKAPNGVPYQNGKPAQVEPDNSRLNVTSYVVTKRFSEEEAWGDLPTAESDILKHALHLPYSLHSWD